MALVWWRYPHLLWMHKGTCQHQLDRVSLLERHNKSASVHLMQIAEAIASHFLIAKAIAYMAAIYVVYTRTT
jgi:hypothetical protein